MDIKGWENQVFDHISRLCEYVVVAERRDIDDAFTSELVMSIS